MMVRRMLPAACAVLLLPTAVLAGTLERVVSLRSGEEMALAVSDAVTMHIVDEQVVASVSDDPGEVKLEAKAAGTTLIFLQGRLGISAWRAYVDLSPPPPRTANGVEAAKAACGTFRESAAGIAVLIDSGECQEAVAVLGKHLLYSDLTVSFNETGLRAQLAAQQARLAQDHPHLAARVQIAYLGATLRVTGNLATIEEQNAVLRSLFEATAGRFLVDLGRLEVAETREPSSR